MQDKMNSEFGPVVVPKKNGTSVFALRASPRQDAAASMRKAERRNSIESGKGNCLNSEVGMFRLRISDIGLRIYEMSEVGRRNAEAGKSRSRILDCGLLNFVTKSREQDLILFAHLPEGDDGGILA